MTIDLQQLAGWITQLGIIAGVIITAYKIIDKHLLKRITTNEKRLNDVERWTAKQQEDINDGAERDRIILDGVLACLKGLQEQGCNGPVTKAIESIEAYISGKVRKTVSKQSEAKGV